MAIVSISLSLSLTCWGPLFETIFRSCVSGNLGNEHVIIASKRYRLAPPRSIMPYYESSRRATYKPNMLLVSIGRRKRALAYGMSFFLFFIWKSFTGLAQLLTCRSGKPWVKSRYSGNGPSRPAVSSR